MLLRQQHSLSEQGSLLISALVFTTIFVIMGTGLLGLIIQQWKLAIHREARSQAIHIAEAGVNYYKWYLDRFVDDYSNGEGSGSCLGTYPFTCGPYVIDYSDPLAGNIGQFELYITPPGTSTTKIKIKSTGWMNAYPNIKRTIGATYGKPAWTQYAILSDSDIRIGSGTEIHGKFHSNGGIRFDGVAYNEITSAVSTYTDTDSDACTVSSWAVHTCVNPADPSPQTPVTSRPDVFIAGRKFPVPAIDFLSVTTALDDLKDLAQDDGLYLNPSNRQGYHIQFLGNNQLRYRTVRTTNTCHWSGGNSAPEGDIYQYQGGWNTASLPANGIIFVEDNAWVDGTLNGSRITLVAAQEPLATGLADIWINNDILYSAKDGNTALGLIAQNNVNVGLYSENDLEINAALLAQKGRVGRYYYPTDCSATYYQRNIIDVYGSIGSNERYGFSWTCGGAFCSGYQTRNLQFDAPMVFAPPPYFPTFGEYTFISWEELLPGENF